MNVLIVCETSGNSREAFRLFGHNAWSCDILPAVDVSPFHHQMDMFDAIRLNDWDLMIAHPSCTYLTGAAEWAYADVPMIKGKPRNIKPGTLIGADRRAARDLALNDVRQLMAAPIGKICIENPVGKISTEIRHADQYIQPYQFGHDASKNTGLWLKNLPLLTPTGMVEPRWIDGRPRWENQTDSGQNKLGPSKDRWKTRSVTYAGISKAMAEQWGDKE